MYRTNDPRFRRRLNEIGQTLESANESAQSGLYIFGQTYVKPCFASIGQCLTSCVDASCPAWNLSQHDRLRRQRGRARSRGRAELSFDFYDDWDEDENDGLLGWGTDEFDRLVGAESAAAAGPGGAGYGTVSQTQAQPGKKKGMAYPKGRRKSAVLPHDGGPDPTVIPGSSGLWGRLFGGKPLRYKPSAAGLQEHPGAKSRRAQRQDLTEGEALLGEHEEEDQYAIGHRRARSGTLTSHETASSYSSRGDLFPSDEETDAIPLDDEFAMVLERRTTQSGSGDNLVGEADASSGRSSQHRRRGKRPSASSRTSTGRRRTQSGKGSRRSPAGSTAPETPVEEAAQMFEEQIPSLAELKQEERRIEQEEEAELEERRLEARKLAVDRGLADDAAILSSKEATPVSSSPVLAPVMDPPQLPEHAQQEQNAEAHDPALASERHAPEENDDDTQP